MVRYKYYRFFGLIITLSCASLASGCPFAPTPFQTTEALSGSGSGSGGNGGEGSPGPGGETAGASHGSSSSGGASISGAGGAGDKIECRNPDESIFDYTFEWIDSCYALSITPSLWGTANTSCQNLMDETGLLGARLMIVSDRNEHNAVRDWLVGLREMPTVDFDGPWIGGHRNPNKDVSQKDAFYWIDSMTAPEPWKIFPCGPKMADKCDDAKTEFWGTWFDEQQPDGLPDVDADSTCVRYGIGWADTFDHPWKKPGLDDDQCEKPLAYLCEWAGKKIH